MGRELTHFKKHLLLGALSRTGPPHPPLEQLDNKRSVRSQQNQPANDAMGHPRRIDTLVMRSYVRFAPFATELLRRSGPPLCATSPTWNSEYSAGVPVMT